MRCSFCGHIRTVTYAGLRFGLRQICLICLEKYPLPRNRQQLGQLRAIELMTVIHLMHIPNRQAGGRKLYELSRDGLIDVILAHGRWS